jgi:diacylglycerol O-acyltransferase / wax synthase
MAAMPDRLRSSELPLLTRESITTPMHVATLEIFEPPKDGFDYARLVALISDRIAFVPRYRQRLRPIPGFVANPVWLDDDDFDLAFHVRRSAVPRPGSMAQLRELVARIMSRRLDRNRPLWETYLVEGLDNGRFAVLSKSHEVLVDGSTVDLGQLILDVDPDPPASPPDEWRARPSPSGIELTARAVREIGTDPGKFAESLRGGLLRARTITRELAAVADRISPRRRRPGGPLAAELSEQRRFETVETKLADYRRIRKVHGGTVNDAVLATVAGALRAWLLTRAESMRSTSRVRALVPMSVVDDEFSEPTSLGSQVSAHWLTLPIGEPNPVMRLHQVSYAMKAHKETGRAVSAERLSGISGFAPTTFHALACRVAASYSGDSYDLLVTNVPGPQFPLFAAGARMLASYPVLPLQPGQSLAIGVTSYDGGVFYGVDADRDAAPDVDVLAQCIVESLVELVDTAGKGRSRVPRGRSAKT